MIRGTATDAELLAATRRDAQAFGAFYDRYERAVLGFFVSRTRDPELAADLTAETFAAALRAASRYRPQREPDTAAPWLFTIAHNVLRASARHGRVEAVTSSAARGVVNALRLGPLPVRLVPVR